MIGVSFADDNVIGGKNVPRGFLDNETLKDLAVAQAHEVFNHEALLGQIDDIEQVFHTDDELNLPDPQILLARQHIAGFHRETKQFIIDMVKGAEPVGAMGNDTAPAAFSDNRRPLSDFYKQMFAQITNPSIHPNTEDDVMSTVTHLGGFYGQDGKPKDAKVGRLPTANISNKTLDVIREKFATVEIDCTFDFDGTYEDYVARIADIKMQAEEAAKAGQHIILTNEAANLDNPDRVPFEILHIGSAVHLHLGQKGLRDQVSINGRDMGAATTHDAACIIGSGLDTFNPGLAEETIIERHFAGEFDDRPLEECIGQYYSNLDAGLKVIMAKKGIAGVASYRGAYEFEAYGLGKEFVAEFTEGVHSEIGGFELEDLYERAKRFHEEAQENIALGKILVNRGIHSISQNEKGEAHANQGVHISALQRATKEENPEAGLKAFLDYAADTEAHRSEHPTQVRDLWDLQYVKRPEDVTEEDLEGVESVEDIMKSYGVASMSFGSTSPEQVRDLYLAAKAVGATWHSGEGGLPKEIKEDEAWGGKSLQVASGRFGIDAEAFARADEGEIKIAQAAKGGEGGQLPGIKVNDEIAEARNVKPGTYLYSMGAHASIKSIEDLAQLVHGLKQACAKLTTAVKTVAMAGIDTIAVGAAKCGTERLTISGVGGGSGAAKKTSQQHTAMPWEIYLPLSHRKLVQNGYRNNLSLSVDGGLSTPRDLNIASILGAEKYDFGKVLMYVLGCKNMGVCDKNVCAFGNATMDPLLRSHYTGKPEHAIAFFRYMAEGQRRELAALGVKSRAELRGRVDLINHARMTDRNFDFSSVLQPFEGSEQGCTLKPGERNDYHDPRHPNALSVDQTIMAENADILFGSNDNWESATIPVGNEDRNIGTELSHHLITQAASRPDHSVVLNTEGVLGQQAGFLGDRRLVHRHVGPANDGYGEGNSGAMRIIAPKPGTQIAEAPHENAIIGNHCFYGSTVSEGYVSGQTGANAFYRLSGGDFVVEGMGANACRFQTGGNVINIGTIGPGAASLTSGGTLLQYDPEGVLEEKIHGNMRHHIQPLAGNDVAEQYVRGMLERHALYSDSPLAAQLLSDWDNTVQNFKISAPAGIDEEMPLPVIKERVAARLQPAVA